MPHDGCIERQSVLLGDFECSARRLLEHEIRNLGYVVHAADDEGGCQRIVEAMRPILVITELRLRSGSGMSLLQRIRSDHSSTAVAILTSYASIASAVKATRLGAAAYVSKPANAARILQAVRGTDDAASLGGAAPALRGGASSWGELSGDLTLDQAVWEYIHQTIEFTGTLSAAARRLGVRRQSLRRMIAKYRPDAADLTRD